MLCPRLQIGICRTEGIFAAAPFGSKYGWANPIIPAARGSKIEAAPNPPRRDNEACQEVTISSEAPRLDTISNASRELFQLAGLRSILGFIRKILIREVVALLRMRHQRARGVKTIGRSTLFDREWYLQKYRDVEQAGVDPVLHYLEHGAVERRNPGPLFDTAWYLDRYRDERSEVGQVGVARCESGCVDRHPISFASKAKQTKSASPFQGEVSRHAARSRRDML